MGFEPTIRHYPYNGLANRRLQPLGHPSTDEWVHGVCEGQPSVSRRGGQPRPMQPSSTNRELAPELAPGHRLAPSAASIAWAAASSAEAENRCE